MHSEQWAAIPVAPLADFIEDASAKKFIQQEALALADVIVMVDSRTRSESFVFGLPQMEDVLISGVSKNLRILKIGVDTETAELTLVLALVTAVKGSHDYDRYDETGD